MRHIQQRNAVDCGLAVVSMLAACRYDEARRADPFPNKNNGLSLSDFVTTLRRCSRVDWRVVRPSEYKPLSLHEIHDVCAAIVRQPDRRYGHWIAIERGIVHDPELRRGVALTEYDRKTWQLIRWVVPCP